MGCRECVDTVGGIPLRLITTYDTHDSCYRVHAFRGDDPEQWFPEFVAMSPDSADQRLFLAIIRTLRADSTAQSGVQSH